MLILIATDQSCPCVSSNVHVLWLRLRCVMCGDQWLCQDKVAPGREGPGPATEPQPPCVCLLRSVPRHHHRGPVFVSPQSIFSSHVSTSIETSSTTTLPSVTTPNIPVHQTTHQPWPQCSILQSSSCISVYMCLSSWKWTVTAPFLHPNPLSPNLRLNLQPDPVKVHPKHLLPLSKWQPHSQDDGNRPSHKRNQVRLEMIELFVCPGPGLMNDCLLWECLPVCRLAMWHGHYSLVTRSTHCQSNNDGQLTYRKAISFSLTSVFHKSKFLFHLKRSLR